MKSERLRNLNNEHEAPVDLPDDRQGYLPPLPHLE
jgi:hypothetical protein